MRVDEVSKNRLARSFIIENFQVQDYRWEFIKAFNEEIFKNNDFCVSFREKYFSVSKKDVIRGMHFQLTPHDHEKLVYVAKGEITDSVLGLRKSSKTDGKAISVLLSDGDHIYI